jgi:hypothetical protein
VDVRDTDVVNEHPRRIKKHGVPLLALRLNTIVDYVPNCAKLVYKDRGIAGLHSSHAIEEKRPPLALGFVCQHSDVDAESAGTP